MPVTSVLRCAVAAALMAFATVAHAQTRIEKQFEDWLVACEETDAAKTCAVSQTLSNAKTKRMALVWVITKGADGSTKAAVRTPVGVLLPEGLKISVGGGDASAVAFRFCGPRACTAEFLFTDDWLAALRKAADLKVSFMSVAGQPITLTVSLKGFSAAYDFFAGQ